MQKVLGIDQSLTCTGYVVSESYMMLEHGTIITSKDDSDLSRFYRMKHISKEIIDVVNRHQIEFVNLEGLGFAATGNATRDLAALQAIIVSDLLDHGISGDNIRIITPNQVKKWGAGKGNAPKEALYDALPEFIKDEFSKYKKTKGRYDVTDAYFLATYECADLDALRKI